MPIYEYKCDECGKHLEVIQRISDARLDKCPECEGRLSKLISNSSFVLKGSGWYADGYSASKPEDKTVSSSSKPSESKPAESKKDASRETPNSTEKTAA